MACPLYVAPARVSFTLKECTPSRPWSITSHAPAAHTGLNCKKSDPFWPPRAGPKFLA
jgi:hypothetical protein